MRYSQPWQLVAAVLFGFQLPHQFELLFANASSVIIVWYSAPLKQLVGSPMWLRWHRRADECTMSVRRWRFVGVPTSYIGYVGTTSAVGWVYDVKNTSYSQRRANVGPTWFVRRVLHVGVSACNTSACRRKNTLACRRVLRRRADVFLNLF